jgi:hypothetical protein
MRIQTCEQVDWTMRLLLIEKIRDGQGLWNEPIFVPHLPNRQRARTDLNELVPGEEWASVHNPRPYQLLGGRPPR